MGFLRTRRRKSLIHVVPANAGTHSHRPAVVTKDL